MLQICWSLTQVAVVDQAGFAVSAHRRFASHWVQPRSETDSCGQRRVCELEIVRKVRIRPVY